MVRAGDGATEFRQRCDGLEIKGVSLHSNRFAWAEGERVGRSKLEYSQSGSRTLIANRRQSIISRRVGLSCHPQGIPTKLMNCQGWASREKSAIAVASLEPHADREAIHVLWRKIGMRIIRQPHEVTRPIISY